MLYWNKFFLDDMLRDLNFYRDDDLLFELKVFVIIGPNWYNFFNNRFNWDFCPFNYDSRRLLYDLHRWSFDNLIVICSHLSDNFLRNFHSLIDVSRHFNFDNSFLNARNFNSDFDFFNSILEHNFFYDFFNDFLHLNNLFHDSWHWNNFLHDLLNLNNLWNFY